MKCCSRFVVLLVLCCTSAAAFAATTERVQAIETDGTIQLESSGKAGFVNIRFTDAKRAESWMAAHLLQQNISFTPEETDRYGRTLITSDMEEKMLRDGVAIIYASEGDVPANWYVAETAARSKKTGVWAEEDLVVTPQNAAQHKDEFHVVEGTVTRIYESKTATYLNFGDDWHTDFSITIPAKIRRSMKEKLAAIKVGSHVRVRGRLYEENGPMVLLGHADNLERY